MNREMGSLPIAISWTMAFSLRERYKGCVFVREYSQVPASQRAALL